LIEFGLYIFLFFHHLLHHHINLWL
jgi:hypothetical protein